MAWIELRSGNWINSDAIERIVVCNGSLKAIPRERRDDDKTGALTGYVIVADDSTDRLRKAAGALVTMIAYSTTGLIGQDLIQHRLRRIEEAEA